MASRLSNILRQRYIQAFGHPWAEEAMAISNGTGASFTQRLSLQDFKLPATLLQLAATAGSSILGLVSGTHGSASPLLVGNAASGNSKSDSARICIAVSPFYAAGATVTLRIRAKATVGLAFAATTVDTLVYRSDLAAGVSSDLCTTNAQTITTSAANYDFTLTPTSMNPGDILDILVTALANDTGGTTGTIIQIYNVELIYGSKNVSDLPT